MLVHGGEVLCTYSSYSSPETVPRDRILQSQEYFSQNIFQYKSKHTRTRTTMPSISASGFDERGQCENSTGKLSLFAPFIVHADSLLKLLHPSDSYFYAS